MAEPGELAPLDDELPAIGSLQEPARRELYRYVSAHRHEVSRDEAAAAVGIGRPVAAFHLDKLVEAGLLEVSYRRLTGRTGPGAGRPAKMYRRSPSEHSVSLPPRHYELAAQLLAEAVEQAGDQLAPESVAAVSRRFGLRLGEEVRASLTRRAGRQRKLAALMEALGRYGYEPRRDRDEVRLGNCPFHALAEGHRRLVCGMNLSLLSGAVEGLASEDLEARLDPRPGECCVTLTPTDRRNKR